MTVSRLMLCLCLSVVVSHVAARDLVIAFDNTLQASSSLDAVARSQMLVRNLANMGVTQAAFLIKTKGLGDKGYKRLQIYNDAGHLLVNTGHGHALVTKAELYAFEIGILRANRILEAYPGYQRHVYFSYLHEHGDTLLQEGLKQFLVDRHFKPAFIGVNPLYSADTYLDQLYQNKIRNNRQVDIVAMEKLYVDFVEQMLAVQSNQALVMLGYSHPQVLVLQENDLAAYFIAAVIERLQTKGWRIVPAGPVFSNPIANPILAQGFGGNSYMTTITGMPDERVAHPRVLGARKAFMDKLIQAHVPSLLQ